MASKEIQSPRGMNDLLPPDSAKWVFFENRCRELFGRYGYQELRTPIVESTDLFARGIGEATDIVEKEMYTFADRKGRSLTMRPEMTASCVRAYVQHGVYKKEPVTRWFYAGPMFRYERAQVGRYRQFYQIGVETFGIADPSMDAEQIAMLYVLYSELAVPNMDVIVNSVGDAQDRPLYRRALLDFLEPHRASLCPDCQRRMAHNPLRVLDCKVATCKAVIQDAPSILDHLGEQSRAHFDAVCEHLSALEVPFRVDPSVVRGLDYYTGPVFEIMCPGEQLGGQSTIVAGGRYDNLVESLGGPKTPAVGFALGVERAILSIPGQPADYLATPAVFFACRGAEAQKRALVLAHGLRRAGIAADLDHRGAGMKAQFKRADKVGARYVIALGDDELASGQVMVRDMQTRAETPAPLADLAGTLANLLGR